ncbi:tetratricopeptide repeat protein [Candidatus Desantisbacteria bacterium]|nr:tetratricopeptide repeat protein [Candidatus Desantisbacteria bacterium]
MKHGNNNLKFLFKANLKVLATNKWVIHSCFVPLCLCAFVPFLFTGCVQSKPYIKPYDYQANREAVLVYEKALAYEKDGNLELAIAEFRHYLDYYGSLYHANEAQLEIAKCCKTLSQWEEAISNYKIFIKKYKRSEKIPEAMFQMGECLETANQEKEAVFAYKNLIKNHFSTVWSQKAQERITEILKKFPRASWARKEKIAVRTLVRTMSRK